MWLVLKGDRSYLCCCWLRCMPEFTVNWDFGSSFLFTFQVRDLDAHIRWADIGNTNILAIIDKEFQKSVRSFKKAIVRRKSSEGSVVKYLLDFGKRRFLPEIVVRCGTIPEEALGERKRYWLEESHMPLHLVKAFEEKRIARKSSKITVEKTKKIMKKPLKIKGFAYLFLKAERSEYYQCGHCNQDVLIRYDVCTWYLRKSSSQLIACSKYLSLHGWINTSFIIWVVKTLLLLFA